MDEAPEPDSRVSQLSVEINIQHDGDFVSPEAIVSTIRHIAHAHSVYSGSISVGVVDDENMHRLNNQFLQHDYTTDVLSFVYDEGESSLDGELILCADYAQRAARDADWPPESELLLYAIHGMLHLLGMDDQTDDGRKEMRDAEREILLNLGVEGAQRHGLASDLNLGEE